MLLFGVAFPPWSPFTAALLIFTSSHLYLVSIRKLPNVILSGAKNLCGHSNYEILRRLAPQNDIQKYDFRMDTN